MKLQTISYLVPSLIISILILSGCTPLSNAAKVSVLQEGNNQPKKVIQVKRSNELVDNRMASIASNFLAMGEEKAILNGNIKAGLKRLRWTPNEAEAPAKEGVIQIDWSGSEFDILSDSDKFATSLFNNGILSTYSLAFWDKANHPQGWQTTPEFSRFKTEEEITRYLNYVRLVVRHYKGLVQYYELWNEPDRGSPIQFIEVNDYINLIKRTVPIIREEDPSAKIVVGSVPIQPQKIDSAIPQPRTRNYLFAVLESDVMPIVDVVSWHPMYGVSPEYESEYYFEYPSIIQEIKNVAAAHGFHGEYEGDEISWRSPDCYWGNPNDPLYSNLVAAKYYARSIIIHLGMDVSTSVADLSSLRAAMYTVVRNLSTLMAGASVSNVSMVVQSTATNVQTA